MFQATDLFMVPFSLMWGGFALFWEFTVLTSGAPLLFCLWGIPFVLIGLHMIVGRFFFESRQRANTYYALTSERVILITAGFFNTSFKSLDLKTLGEVNLIQAKEGKGSIIFGPNPFANQFANFPGMSGMMNAKMTQFLAISEAKQVYELIQQTKRMA